MIGEGTRVFHAELTGTIGSGLRTMFPAIAVVMSNLPAPQPVDLTRVIVAPAGRLTIWASVFAESSKESVIVCVSPSASVYVTTIVPGVVDAVNAAALLGVTVSVSSSGYAPKLSVIALLALPEPERSWSSRLSPSHHPWQKNRSPRRSSLNPYPPQQAFYWGSQCSLASDRSGVLHKIKIPIF